MRIFDQSDRSGKLRILESGGQAGHRLRVRDTRGQFENFFRQIIDPIEMTASARDENSFADVVDEGSSSSLPFEQLECFAQAQMDNRVERLAFDLFPRKTGIVFQQNRLARQTIAKVTLPSSIFSFSARAIGMRNPIEMSLVM